MKNSVRYKRKSKRSRAVKRRLVVATVLVVVALAIWATVRPHARATSEREAAVPVVQLRVVHPTPEPAAWTPQELAQLRGALQADFAPALGDRYSLVVLDARGRVIYDNHGESVATPASVQKLIVADAALHVLGPLYRFHTIFAAEKAPSPDGALDGNLWLVGSGDPSLRSDDLRAGVAMLKRNGLRRINGAIAVDSSMMTGPEINPHWNPDDAGEDFQVPTSAISIDDDTAEFRVDGGAPGTPAHVAVVPASGSALSISGAVQTSVSSDDVIIAPDAPDVFRLDGTIPENTEETFNLPVHDMPHYAGDVLSAMAKNAGISVGDAPAVAPAPLDTIVLWDHRSAPLRELLGHMLFVSDNHYAEQMMRTLGIDVVGTGSDAGGLTAEHEFLNSAGIPTGGLHVVDGSGLSETDRVSAMTLARILSDAELTGNDLYSLLPEGGRDGTLRNYDFTTALGRVRAKTGHLSDADSLAGYVTTIHHGRLAFAFMINDSPGDPDSAYVSAVDRLAEF